MHTLLFVSLALTLIFWGLSHFDLGRAARAISIATGIFAVLSGVILLIESLAGSPLL